MSVPSVSFSKANPDDFNRGAPFRFMMGGGASALGMWFLMRGTPLFNLYHKVNPRLVTVLFPTWVIGGLATNVLYDRARERAYYNKWHPNTPQVATDQLDELVDLSHIPMKVVNDKKYV